MGALALAPLLACSLGRAAATGGGAVLGGRLRAAGDRRARRGASAARSPCSSLGGWLGFGHSALRADGLAGIFLALTGLTGAAVSLAYAELPAGRWLTALGSDAAAVRRGRDRLRQRLPVLPGLGGDHRLRLPDRQRRPRPRGPARRLSHRRAGEDRRRRAARRVRAAVRAHAQLLAGGLGARLAAGRHARRAVRAVPGLLRHQDRRAARCRAGCPPATASAPRLGAASLSVALCAGFYGLWRFEFQILGPLPTWCGDALLILGAITALTGIVYALTQDNLRRFLGYSTVEHAGIVLVGLGVALLGQAAHKPMLAAAGLLAATLHVCAHNLAKTLALISVDRVEQATGQRTLDPLGGLARPLPPSAVALGRLLADARGDPAARADSSASGSPSRRCCRAFACRRCSRGCCARWPPPRSR